MKTFKVLGSVGLVALFSAYGCGSDEETTTSGAGGAGGTTTSSVVGPGPSTTTTSSTGGSVVDESKNCADAVVLELGQNQQSGVKFYFSEAVLGEPNDQDFFKFTAKKGDWVNIATEANPDDDPSMVDTVVSLYNEDGTKTLAEVDDSFPRVSTDSNFNFRVPEDGTYCVGVQEFSAWKGQDPEGDPSYAYAMVVLPYDADNVAALGGLEMDMEPNNGTGAPQVMTNLRTLQNGQVAVFPYGALEPQGDTDVYEMTTPAGALALSMNFEPSGTPNGNGSTGNIGIVNVLDGDTKAILGQLDYGQATGQVDAGGDYGFSALPVVAGKKYLFEVGRKANSMLGANDFYFFKAFTVDTLNPQETNNAGNGQMAGAEAMMPQVNPNDPSFTNRFIGGSIPAGDTDFWKFDAEAGDKIIVVCSSRRAGSGVADFKVDLLDSAQMSIQSETEQPTQDLLWSDTGETASKKSVTAKAGTYYVKLSSTMMVANGASSSHYLCGIHTQTP